MMRLPPYDSPPPVPDESVERAGRVLTAPLVVTVGGILGTIALLWGLVAAVQTPRAPQPTVSLVEGVPVHMGGHAPHYAPLATSITPITAITDAKTGFAYSGDSFNVLCTVSGEVTLYPAVYTGSGDWKVFQGYPQTLSASIATRAFATLPAPLEGSGLTWNVFKMGTGSVSSCTAEGRSGPVPSSRSPSGSAGGDLTGTYPNPTVDGIQGRAVASTAPANGQVLWWVASVNQWQPTTLSGISPGGSAGGDLGGTYPNPTVTGLRGRGISSTAPANGQVYWWVAAANEWQPTTLATGTGTVTSVGLSAPSIFSVSGSPVTDAGTLAIALASQSANLVFAGPSSGAAAAPTFRALVSDDIPSLAASKIGSGTFDIARIPTGTTSTTVPTGGVVTGASCAFPTTFTFNNAGQVTACTAGSAPGAGTVTSVGLSMPSDFSVASSPVTSSGTIAVTYATQTANLVFAGPSSGGAATPTFRALVATDLPTVTVAKGGTGLTSYTVGDLLYASGATTLAGLADVATGQVLVSGGVGTAPAWSASPTVTTLTASTSVLTVLLDRASAGTLTLGGTATTVQLAAGASLSGAAGAGALSLGSMTGNTTLPTGSISYTGASTKTISLVTTGAGSSITITAGADSVWSTSAGALSVTSADALTITGGTSSTWSTSAGSLAISGGSALIFRVGGAARFDVDLTTASAITIATGIVLDSAATFNLATGTATGITIGRSGQVSNVLGTVQINSAPTAATFFKTCTITSAAAATPVVCLAAADVPAALSAKLGTWHAYINGATNWATTATCVIEDTAGNDLVTLAVAAMTGNTFIDDGSANVTKEAGYRLGTGGAADAGLQISCNANGTGSDAVFVLMGTVQ